MERRDFLQASMGMTGLLTVSDKGFAQTSLPWFERDYLQGSEDSLPYVYWPWMNGHITYDGISRDLQAMREMGIRGACILNTAIGTPQGPVGYNTLAWRDLVRHASVQARREGIELILHNAAGYAGTGGKWVKPEQSQQHLVWTEALHTGGDQLRLTLAQPFTKLGFYRDVAVLAYPALPGEALAGPGRSAIDPAHIVDISRFMDAQGQLDWDAPPGRWVIVRLGHTPTGEHLAAAADSGSGLNIDMFDPAMVEAHFEQEIDPLLKVLGVFAGKSFRGLHFDSYEGGRQNWSARFPEYFQALRGYELGPWLLTMTGRIVGDDNRSEKALYDIRRTHAELIAKHYYGRFRTLCHQRRLEVHGEPAQLAASAAHLRGTPVMPLEAFSGEPASSAHAGSLFALKSVGDRLSTLGATRFVLHTFVHQPYEGAQPGMTIGPFGVHFDRNAVWASQLPAFTGYVARTHHVLRQGAPLVDIACFKGEQMAGNLLDVAGAPFSIPPGYRADTLDAAALGSLRARDRSALLPSGLAYAAIVLPPLPSASEAVLSALIALAEQGVPVFAQALPLKGIGAPLDGSLDQRIAALSAQLAGLARPWQPDAGERVLAQAGLAPALTFVAERREAFLNYQHRRIGDDEVYYIAQDSRQRQRFAVSVRGQFSGALLWDAASGALSPALILSQKGGRTEFELDLAPSGAVFLILPKSMPALPLLASKPFKTLPLQDAQDSFTVSLWCKPEIALLTDRPRGLIVYPPQGDRVYGKGHAIAGIGVGRRGVILYERSLGKAQQVLALDAGLDGWVHLAVVYDDGVPTIYLNGNARATGKRSAYQVHPAINFPAAHEQICDRFEGDVAGFDFIPRALAPADLAANFRKGLPAPEAAQEVEYGFDDKGAVLATVRRAGHFGLRARGAAQDDVRSMALRGPWRLAFPAGSGAPASLALPKLVSLHQHAHADVRHFAGTVSYRQTQTLSAPLPGQRLLLDLGRVESVAEVSLNGKLIATLWKPPFEADITDAVVAGLNRLEVRVTVLAPNRLIGDEALPAEAQYGEFGNITALPAWYVAGRPKPGARKMFSTWRQHRAGDPLLASGLMGPVTLTYARRHLV